MNSKKRQQERGCRYSSLHSSDHPSIISSWMWLMKYHPCVHIAFPCGLIQPGTYSSSCANDHQLAASIHHTSIYEDSHSMPSHVWLIKHHTYMWGSRECHTSYIVKTKHLLAAGRQAASFPLSVCPATRYIPPPPACPKQSSTYLVLATHKCIYVLQWYAFGKVSKLESGDQMRGH